MYLEPNNPSLSFAEFLEAAVRDKAKKLPFPYTLEVCRCRYCSFCKSTSSCFNSLTHTTTSFKRALTVLAERTIAASAHL